MQSRTIVKIECRHELQCRLLKLSSYLYGIGKTYAVLPVALEYLCKQLNSIYLM